MLESWFALWFFFRNVSWNSVGILTQMNFGSHDIMKTQKQVLLQGKLDWVGENLSTLLEQSFFQTVIKLMG
jgi:hypothetical protein